MRYVAFLRGVSPMNAKMPQLKRCFESAGFTDVKTVLSSGNVVFSSPAKPPAVLARQAEAAMAKHLDRTFATFVRSAPALERLLAADPFAAFSLPANAKRVVTFLRHPPKKFPALPLALEDARILAAQGSEAFCVYVPGPNGPVFMTLIEKTFTSDVTTRTWDTIRKCITAAHSVT